MLAWLPMAASFILGIGMHPAIDGLLVPARDGLQRIRESGLLRIRESILLPSNDKIKIREANLSDLPSIIHLRTNVFHPEYTMVASYHQRVFEKLRERIEVHGSIVLIAYRNKHGAVARGNGFFGNVVGTVEISPNDFKNTTMETIGAQKKLYIADLAVRQDARRLGLATKLLQTIEDYARTNGFLELFLHVDKVNPQGLNLYTKNGYRHIGQADWATHFTEARLSKDADNFHFLYKSMISPNSQLFPPNSPIKTTSATSGAEMVSEMQPIYS